MARPLSIAPVGLDKVTPDSPTGRTDAPATPAATEAKPLPASIDEALGSKDQSINNRVPNELWDLVAARAEQLGVKLRPLLTDALVRALEDDVSTHRERIDQTQRRQAYARIERR